MLCKCRYRLYSARLVVYEHDGCKPRHRAKRFSELIDRDESRRIDRYEFHVKPA